MARTTTMRVELEALRQFRKAMMSKNGTTRGITEEVSNLLRLRAKELEVA